MYILLNMPPVVQLDPRPAVLYWLNDKDRCHKTTEKASKQHWFRHTFSQGQEDDDTQDMDGRLLRKF